MELCEKEWECCIAVHNAHWIIIELSRYFIVWGLLWTMTNDACTVLDLEIDSYEVLPKILHACKRSPVK